MTCVSREYVIIMIIELRHEKTSFMHMRKQRRRSASLFNAFVFATRIVQSLYFLNLKFQASSHLLWLYSPVCVRPGRKPRRPVFSHRGSYILYQPGHIGAKSEQSAFIIELQREKICLRCFRPGPTQTGLYNNRRWLEA